MNVTSSKSFSKITLFPLFVVGFAMTDLSASFPAAWLYGAYTVALYFSIISSNSAIFATTRLIALHARGFGLLSTMLSTANFWRMDDRRAK